MYYILTMELLSVEDWKKSENFRVTLLIFPKPNNGRRIQQDSHQTVASNIIAKCKWTQTEVTSGFNLANWSSNSVK